MKNILIFGMFLASLAASASLRPKTFDELAAEIQKNKKNTSGGPGPSGLIGSGGVQGLKKQQSACAVPVEGKPWKFLTVDNSIAAEGEPGTALMAFSPNGRFLAVGYGFKPLLSVFLVKDNGMLLHVKGSPSVIEMGNCSLSFSPDSNKIVITHESNKISVFSINDSDGVLSQVKGSPYLTKVQNARPLAFSPDGKFLAVGDSNSKEISVFSMSPSGLLNEIEESPFEAPDSVYGYKYKNLDLYGYKNIAFSSDGKFLNGVHRTGLSIFSVRYDGRLVAVDGSPFELQGIFSRTSAFSFDSRLFAWADNPKVSIFELNAGRPTPVTGWPRSIPQCSHQRKIVSYEMPLAFYRKGNLLAIAHSDCKQIEIFLVNSNNQAPLQKLQFDTDNFVHSLAFSPNDNLLAVATYSTDHLNHYVSMYEVDPDTNIISPITGGELKATKRKKEYEEARKVLVKPIPHQILPEDVVKNVLREFIVGPKPVKEQEKQEKDSKELDDAIQQKIIRTQEQETSRVQDQEKLFEAIKKGDEKGVAEYLTPFTINATNEKDEFRGTPLLAATRLNNAAIVKKILDYEGEIVRADKVPYSSKANLMAKDKDGNTALLSAIFNHDDYKIALTIAEEMTPEERKAPIKDGASAIVYLERFQKKAANKADYEKLKALLQK